MRKISLLLLAFILLLLPSQTSAQDEDSRIPEVTTVNSNETINKDYLAFNERVEIFGTVNGDVYTAGGMVHVEGRINGDLFVGGGQVTIAGEVTQDVRVAGGQVTINGRIGRNLTSLGGNVDVSSGANITGSVIAGGGNVTISAPVGGNVKVGGGNVTLSNTVGGEVEAWVGALRLTPNARVAGNLTYWSTEDISLASGAVVTGTVTKNIPQEPDVASKEKILGIITGIALFFKILSLVTLLIVGLILIKFLPVFNASVISNLTKNPWGSLGIGFLILILGPILSVVLLVTVIGAPLGLILLILYGILLFLSRVFVIYFLGSWLVNRTNSKFNEYITLLIGILAYGLVTLIPFIGSLVTFFTTLFALGALFFAKKETYLQARSKKII